MITYVITIGVVVSLVQYWQLLQLEFNFLCRKETRRPMLLSSIIMALYMIDTLFIASGFILNNQIIKFIGILFMVITGIPYLLFENRYPDFYQFVSWEENQKKYKRNTKDL